VAGTRVRYGAALLDTAQLRHALLFAAKRGMQTIANDEWPSVDFEGETWSQPVEFEDPTGISVFLRIKDENRYFDLNNLALDGYEQQTRSPFAVVMDLLTFCGDFSSVKRTEALQDWVDSDTDGFYENSFYIENNESAYETPDTGLESMGELYSIEGYDHEYLAEKPMYSNRRNTFEADINDCITILPGLREKPVPVNINTAARSVLLGLVGLEEEEWVDKVVAIRRERPIPSLDAAFTMISAQTAKEIEPFVDVKSRFFGIHAVASVGEKTETLYVLAQRQPNGDVQVVRWVY
jgi:type II secretory pathway component PulK